MKNSFIIFPEKKIIFETLSQDINPKDYSELKFEEFRHKQFNRNYNLITDLRNFKLNGNADIIQNIIDVLMENKGKMNRKKSAIICNNFTELNKILNTHPSYSEIKVFTSQKEAENWTKQ